MSEVERIADQVASGNRDGAWPSVSVRDLLRSLSPAEAALEGLDAAHRSLVDAVRTLSPEKLDQLVPGRSFTVYFMLHGVPQHDLYHGGQVMLLTKAIRAGGAGGAP